MKKDAVARALREAFNVGHADEVDRITGGQTSSLVFRLGIRGRSYVLKIITRPDDPTHHYTHMQAAASAGLAPRIYYTDVADKISITDFVITQPFSRAEALLRLPQVLRRLHSLPPFARLHFNTTCSFLLKPGPAVDAWLQKFRTSNLLPKAEMDEFLGRCTELCAGYRSEVSDLVSSHNDLFKPDNILFDGGRVWLVDWEASFLNDRYADLAVVANQLVTCEEEERVFLQEYFGLPPTESQRARLHHMQQITHLFYAMAFLSLGSAGQPIDWAEPVADFGDLQRRLWSGEVDLASKIAQINYGRAHWRQSCQKALEPRYRESLQILSGG